MLFRMLAVLPAMFMASAALAMEDGEYTGIADGGTMTLTVHGNSVHIGVGGEGCGGEGKGLYSKVADSHWRGTLKWEEYACNLDIVQQGEDRFNIQSVGPDCNMFHGATCAFDGFVSGPRN